MADFDITFETNVLTEVIPFIDRISRLQPRTITNLEQTLKAMFGLSQALCPVVTGSLRNSGKTESETDGTIEWTGTMSYGGSSPGFPNDPVDYAIYVRAYYGDASWWDQSIAAYTPQFGDVVAANSG